MRVLATGHLGYIGTILSPILIEAGHEVVGMDSDLYSRCTFSAGGGLPVVPDDINHRASVRLAELAKEVGVRRFVFASSCSNYGQGVNR
jgi:nucleoside-diphosphate-sugar epimerase